MLSSTDLRARDEKDAERMQPAEDAQKIDTTDLRVEDVVERIEEMVRALLGGMNRIEFLWPFGRYLIGWPGALTARVRVYGNERIPQHGGVVLAMNHFSWIDIPCFGVACPRNIYFVAKAEAHEMPGLGQFIRAFGSFACAARRVGSRSRAPHARGRA